MSYFLGEGRPGEEEEVQGGDPRLQPVHQKVSWHQHWIITKNKTKYQGVLPGLKIIITKYQGVPGLQDRDGAGRGWKTRLCRSKGLQLPSRLS